MPKMTPEDIKREWEAKEMETERRIEEYKAKIEAEHRRRQKYRQQYKQRLDESDNNEKPKPDL